MRLLLFGPPGVGKGSQAMLLAEEFTIPHISTGEMLRSAVAAGTELGRKAKAIMESGKLVPDDIMIGIVRDVLSVPEKRKGFILDGFPRTLQQAKALTKIFKEFDISNYHVIDIQVDDEELIRRLGTRLMCEKEKKIFNSETDNVKKGGACPDCGARLIQRNDDKEETVRERLKVYHAVTAPVIAYYKAEGVVMGVDGSSSIDVVNRGIKMLLKDAGEA